MHLQREFLKNLNRERDPVPGTSFSNAYNRQKTTRTRLSSNNFPSNLNPNSRDVTKKPSFMDVMQQEHNTLSPRKMVTKKATQLNQNANFGLHNTIG